MKLPTLTFSIAVLSYVSISNAFSADQNTEEIMQYSFFKSVFNETNDISIIKINKTLSKRNIIDSYDVTVNKAVEFDTTTINSVLLANEFEHKHEFNELYANGELLNSSYKRFTGIISNKALNTVYESKNNKKLTYILPLNYIDISHQPIFSLKDNKGVYVKEMTIILSVSDSDELSIDKPSVASSTFPVGSKCLKFEEIKFNFPHYSINLDTYDTNLKTTVSSKLEYDSLEHLIQAKDNEDLDISNIKMDKVGINNNINAVRIISDSEFFDTAYVEYNKAIYKSLYWKSRPKTAVSNYNAIVCIGFNDIASNFLEKQFIKFYQ